MNKNYIKMCIQADEIQELWEPKPGDLFYEEYSEKNKQFSKEHWLDADDHNGSFYHVSDSLDFINGSHSRYSKQLKEKCVYCPSQEDLQEIAFREIGLTTDLILGMLIDYYNEEYMGDGNDLTSLWLCFVMEKCFKKRWDSEKEEWTFI